MKWLQELVRRTSYLGRRGSFEDDLEQEIRFHLEARTEELEASGMSRQAALAQARREFGSAARMREETRSAWQIRWLEDLAGDLRYALRALRRSPGFALAAIFSLALGIGANTTIFSLTMEFLFSEPSAQKPEKLATVRIGGNSHSPLAEYRVLRDARVFDGLAGLIEDAEVNWRTGEDTYRLQIMRATENFFEVTGAPLAIGRPFQSGDANSVVLSHRFWQSRFSGNPDAVGRIMVLDGRPFTVAGVLPRDHRTLIGFGLSPDLYLPVTNDKDIVMFVARLPDDMSWQVAYARLKAACEELDKIHPRQFGNRWAEGIQVNAVAGIDRLKSVSMIPIAAFFGMLMVVVGLVLAIACANVASLLLARASSRRQELGIRLAIGASRSRIVRQLLAESLLLAVLGSVAGLVLNLWLTGFMNRVYLPVPVPIQLLIAPDWRLLCYSIALALGSALLCGLMPALKATRSDLYPALKQQREHEKRRRWKVRDALVMGQLAVSVLLLATGFLFLRNLFKATSMNPGFNIDRTAWAFLRLVPEKYTRPEQQRALVTTALEALRAIPGVEAASIARGVPLNDHNRYGTDTRTDLNERPVHTVYTFNAVGPDYFQTMGIPIVQGREFLRTDRSGAPGVVILNENFARWRFGTANPVGHTIRFGDGPPITVVGVAKNSKYFTLGENHVMALYSPYLQQKEPMVKLHFLVRTAGPPAAALQQVNATLGALDPSAALETKAMTNALGLAFLPSRVGAALLGCMGLLGLMLAAIGLYGVLAYSVSRRIREIGVRVALGAESGDILGMVFRESLLLVAVGVIIGLGVALLATRPLAMFLVPGLSPTDPAAFLGVIGVLVAVAFAATMGPARRALRVDPMVALRYE